MARVQIPFCVETHVTVSGEKVVAPVVGASISVKNRDTSATVAIFAAETGSSTIPSPITDENGNIPGWLEEGSYTITVSGGSPAIAPVEKPFEAVRGDGVSIVASGIITPAMLASSTTQLLVPTGTILPFCGTILPSGGYLWGTGQAVSRTTYSTLFGVMGTTYGSGNGSTTFNVPDMRGRTAVGADNFGGAGKANRLEEKTYSSDGLTNHNFLGGTGGQYQHVLSQFELAEHNHNAESTDFGHLHASPPGEAPYYTFMTTNTGGPYQAVVNLSMSGPESASWQNLDIGNGFYTDTETGNGKANIGTTVFFRGRNEAHNTMPPYSVHSWIIKT